MLKSRAVKDSAFLINNILLILNVVLLIWLLTMLI